MRNLEKGRQTHDNRFPIHPRNCKRVSAGSRHRFPYRCTRVQYGVAEKESDEMTHVSKALSKFKRDNFEHELRHLIVSHAMQGEFGNTPDKILATAAMEAMSKCGKDNADSVTASQENAILYYTKKPITVEAHQWHKNGDHKDVLPYRSPLEPEDAICTLCGRPVRDHGCVKTFEDMRPVCPGDWIIDDGEGKRYIRKPDVFDATYEKASALENPAQTAPKKPRLSPGPRSRPG